MPWTVLLFAAGEPGAPVPPLLRSLHLPNLASAGGWQGGGVCAETRCWRS